MRLDARNQLSPHGLDTNTPHIGQAIAQAQVRTLCGADPAPATPASPDLPNLLDPQLPWLSGTSMTDGAIVFVPMYQPNVNSRLPATSI